MLQAGKGPQDILNYGEAVKAFFKARPKPQLTPISRTTLTSFFSAIASDIGSQDSQ